MADLASLRELYAWMRKANVLYARCGDLELRLESSPAPPAVHAPTDMGEEDDPERRSLETLLYSSGAEVEPFLRVMRGQKAEVA